MAGSLLPFQLPSVLLADIQKMSSTRERSANESSRPSSDSSSCRAWSNADSKAHVVLGLDGTFVTFVASSAFQSPENLRDLLASISLTTSMLLIAMSVTLLFSISVALYCLLSRIYLVSSLDAWMRTAMVPPKAADQYLADVV